MTDAQHREQVRRDAIAMGWTPALAAFLADRVDRPPTEAERDARLPHAALRTRASKPTTTADRLQRIAEMFGAAELVPDFKAAGVSLRHVISLLTDATGSARSIPPGGIDRIRVQLLQRGMAA